MPASACEITVTTTPVASRGQVVAVGTRVRITGPDFAAVIRAWRDMGSPGTAPTDKGGTTSWEWHTQTFPTLAGVPAAPAPLAVTQPAPPRT